MTELDLQLHHADNDGFVDRRPQLDPTDTQVVQSREHQLQIESAEWEGFGISTTPMLGEETRRNSMINRLRGMDADDRQAARAFAKAEAEQPPVWETPNTQVMRPDVPTTPSK